MGLFSIAENHKFEVQSLDEKFVKNKTSTFFFEASSDAMSPEINKGDILIVDRSIVPVIGHIVLAVLDGEFLCRQLSFFKTKNGLKAFNEKYSFIDIQNQNDFFVWGVVSGLARDLDGR